MLMGAHVEKQSSALRNKRKTQCHMLVKLNITVDRNKNRLSQFQQRPEIKTTSSDAGPFGSSLKQLGSKLFGLDC